MRYSRACHNKAPLMYDLLRGSPLSAGTMWRLKLGNQGEKTRTKMSVEESQKKKAVAK